MLGPRHHRALFFAVFGFLTGLSALPFWLTRILPMQDYPHFLVFARVYGDCRVPGSPFHGTYTTGFPLAPLVLPIVLTRAIALFSSFETAGRVIWTLYAVGLPLASLHLLGVLRRDPWCVLLVFPLVISYWVVGGFFAFSTGMPLLLLGLAAAVQWLSAPTPRRGLTLAALVVAAFFWHALIFAQLALDFGLLWLLHRGDGERGRARALWPLAPALAIFAAWILASVRGHAPGQHPPAWAPFLENATRFFGYLGPLPQATGAAFLLLLALLAAGAATSATLPGASLAFRVKNPFAWLSIVAAVSFAIFPEVCFGVEGINNRQPYIAALLFVFAWSLPARRGPRVLVLGALGVASAIGLAHLGKRFAAFNVETAGASRLLDRVGPRETLLAPIDHPQTASFPGKPLVALGLYATIRSGGLPNASFAGYEINLIRYVNDRNPMPGLSPYGWQGSAAITKFDYVLLRDPMGPLMERNPALRLIGKDSGFWLFSVCGGGTQPECPKPPATPTGKPPAASPSSAPP
ncbi:MAG: hypothetical protein ABJE95_07805 [Byssovorax sp.]